LGGDKSPDIVYWDEIQQAWNEENGILYDLRIYLMTEKTVSTIHLLPTNQ